MSRETTHGKLPAEREPTDLIREAEQDYLSCVADHGSESGEALSARWRLGELRRELHRV